MTRYGVLIIAPALLLCALASPPPGRGQGAGMAALNGNIQITLNKTFIADFKDRVTIDADDFVIDKAHSTPNPPSQDGDMHVAGRANKSVGLPIVAEIMNARDPGQKAAVKKVHQLEGTGQKVKVSGAWRLWCEHAGTSKQVQGAPLNQPFTTTNPDHVFEIHPITNLGGLDLTDAFTPIKGFKPKDAHNSFHAYENLRCLIRPAADAVTLVTVMGGFNYVEFVLELNEEPVKLKDGYAALCKVREVEGDLLVRNRRMLFAAGTEPAERVKGLKEGKRLHVLGLPRIDLALVAWRVEHANDAQWKDDDPLKWNLPYEIVVVGVYPDGNGDGD